MNRTDRAYPLSVARKDAGINLILFVGQDEENHAIRGRTSVQVVRTVEPGRGHCPPSTLIIGRAAFRNGAAVLPE